MLDPWQALNEQWPWIPVYIRHLPDRWGQTVWTGGKPHIELAHDLGHVQQRCTLAHEIQHIEAGQPCTSHCGQNERVVTEATARWLLPDLTEVGAALADQDIGKAAAELSVTRQVLIDRLTSLTDREEAEIAPLLTTPDTGSGIRAADQPRRTPADASHSCRPTRSRTPKPSSPARG